jgi:hypothetical protein
LWSSVVFAVVCLFVCCGFRLQATFHIALYLMHFIHNIDVSAEDSGVGTAAMRHLLCIVPPLAALALVPYQVFGARGCVTSGERGTDMN